MSSVLECRGLSKSFHEGGLTVDVLQDVNFAVKKGERIAIIGASGSGKSTLLHLLGGLDTPNSGEIWIDGEDMSRLSDTRRGRLRNRALGFVYQFHHLLAEFNALENVAMPLLIRGLSTTRASKRAADMLARAAFRAGYH